MLDRREIFDDEHDAFRAAVAAFLRREVVPHYAAWERDGIVPRELFARAGALGMIAMAVPAAYGGAEVRDFRFNAIVSEEAERAGIGAVGLGFALQSDICLPYFLDGADEDQRARWLPGLADGTLIAAVAMTEPGAGSDVAGIRSRAHRDGSDYVLTGAKTFISNGINADLIITAAVTGAARPHDGLTLFVLERGMPGIRRSRLEKLGNHAQDTAELAFDDVRVPGENVLGPVGAGFRTLMANLAQERLSIAVAALAGAETAFHATLGYARHRTAFGQAIGAFQHSRFALAEMRTELEVSRSFLDDALLRHVKGRLSPERAAMAKWWCTELQGRILDRCLQLHGGYGYMTEYAVGRAWRDARASRIYGGTTEVMKEIIGRSMGLRG